MGKLTLLLAFLACAAGAAPAPTNSNFILVTNWTKPTGIRVISNQVYNVNLSSKWESIDLPVEAGYQVHSYKGVPKAPLLMFVTLQGRAHSSVSSVIYKIRNFPYDPSEFASGRYDQIYPAHPMRVRLFHCGSETNWSKQGIPLQITRNFDYGLPYDKLVPQVVKQPAPINKYEQYALALRYLKGDGVERDQDKAREWLQKAAAQDHAEAKAALAKLQTHSNP